MATNNQYWKEIYENLSGTTVSGNHPDNYYMKLIAEALGESYTTVNCNNKYAKDIAENITSTTYDASHYTHYYIKESAECLTGESYKNQFDNYLLGIIAENIGVKENARLVWGVPPSNMEYSDFNATGILTDTKSDVAEVIGGATIYLVVGNTEVDSAVTDSNGVATFTNSPVSVGTHDFKLVFKGDKDFKNAESSTVRITVSKETTYLNVTSATSTTYTDGSISISGVLLDNDSTPNVVPNAEINILSNNTVLDTVTTNSNGRFSSEFSIDTAGTYSLRVNYAGDSNYNGSYSNVNVNVVAPSISLSSDKSILSYYDEDTCTLSASLMSESNVGKTISFKIYKFSDDSLVETLTDVTDSSGKASVTYESKGIGDVYCEASFGTLSSETYSLEDCYYWNEQGITVTSNSSSDRKVVSGLEDVVNFIPNGDFEFSFTLQDSTSGKRLYLISVPQSTSTTNYYGIGGDIATNNLELALRTTSTDYTTAPKTNPANFKFVRNGADIQMYANDNLVTTKTASWIDQYAPYTISWAVWATGTATAKNIKIKQL